ncbi:MAG: hypothetical protein RMK79_02530 [Anaerolineae bacterium]|nr:hypothetical protein [Anaerolineae bacterium]
MIPRLGTDSGVDAAMILSPPVATVGVVGVGEGSGVNNETGGTAVDDMIGDVGDEDIASREVILICTGNGDGEDVTAAITLLEGVAKGISTITTPDGVELCGASDGEVAGATAARGAKVLVLGMASVSIR